MKKFLMMLLSALLLIGAPAAAEKAASDGSGRANALAMLGYDFASATTRMVAVDPSSHAMLVMLSGATGTVFVASGSIAISTGTVDIGNGPGAAAVNIQDGGNSITVDGTVAVSSIPNVTITPIMDYESIDQDIPPLSCVDISPSATSTYFVFSMNPATSTVLTLSNDAAAPATLTTGTYCNLCSWDDHELQTAYMNACNTGAATVSVNIRYGR